MVYINQHYILLIFLFLFQVGKAQNLVTNPNFTERDTCPYNFGQIYFASPWLSDNDQSPDLYDSCDIGGFYEIPINFGCATLVPEKDNGVVGIVTFGKLPDGRNIREIATTRLIAEPPSGVDVYCSMVVSPRVRCIGNPDIPNYNCYSNGIGMAIIYRNEAREIVFQADEIVDNIGTWRTLRGCYEPRGDEARIQIQNFHDNSVTKSDCYTIDPDNNNGYTFVDNIVVAPFDILPDTLLVCDIENIQFQGVQFYDLPLSWSDEVIGIERTFEEGGTYTLLGDAGTCLLEETIEVIVVDESVLDRSQNVSKCKNEHLVLSLDIPGSISWDDRHIGSSFVVTQPGKYVAAITTICDSFIISFEVTEVDCDELVYAPNIFSPNNDNINETIIFYFNPDIVIEGTIEIYDRWGSLVFQNSNINELSWNGKTTNGDLLEEGVYIWIFRSQDKSIIQTGDITLIR